MKDKRELANFIHEKLKKIEYRNQENNYFGGISKEEIVDILVEFEEKQEVKND